VATAKLETRNSKLDPVVAHPLDRLRGTIRRYVVVEGLLAAAVFLAGWFAVALAVDFGLFKLATWDWVLDAPAWVRGAALAAVALALAVLVALRIAGRLARELSYPALALVLERRYPQELGDRLITAVELADVEGQARYGYSGELIRRTIDEARERVARVPVNDVFNWRRLRVMAAVALGLVLLVVLVGYAAFVISTGSASPYRYGWRFAHVAGTFFDRNVFLGHAPWPRRAHLELVDFDGDDRRVGRDAPPPVVAARAYRWVVADRAAPMGWRPLAWGDLDETLIGGPVPELPAAAVRAAAESGGFAADPAGWPLDGVQTALDDPNVRAGLSAALHPDAYLAVQNGLERVFAALEGRAADPAMGRRLRKLDVPDKVTLAYSGPSKSGDVTLAPQQGQEFAAPVADLKESVRFVVRAEDFRTAPRSITLVPPPLFTKLVRTEYQPAYLYHAPPQDEGYPSLAGRRQRVADKPVSLTGDRSVFTVPAGTELVLTATTDTDLTKAYLQPKVGLLPGAKPGSADPVPVPVGDDRRTVTIAFRGDDRLAGLRTVERYSIDPDGWLVAETETTSTPTVEFDLVVEQADGVPARRSVLIQVAEDQPPAVEVAVDAVRKVGAVYYVTPSARVPFNPESFVRDDHGLSKLAYEVVYWADESDAARAIRGQLVAGLFLSAPVPAGLPAGILPEFHARTLRATDRGDAKQTGSFLVQRFEDQKNELRRETRAVLEARLQEPAGEAEPQVVTRVDLKSPDRDYFDVRALKLGASVSEVQPRYRLDLNVVATDTNYDTGPKTGRNPDLLRFLVVSEGDLLAEINKEEEQFAARLDDALAKLAGARRKWDFVRTETAKGVGGGNTDNLDSVRVRAADAGQDVAKARDTVQSVVREYRRIHRECVVNVVTEVTRDRFGLFANQIDRVCGENPPAVTEAEGRQLAAGQLQPRMTFPVAEKRVEGVLEALGGGKWADPAAVSDADQALTVLEQEVRALRTALGELQSKEKLKKMLVSVIEGQKRISKELEELRRLREERLTKKEPELGAVGPQFLAKGESKKLKQAINWAQYDKDELVVRLAAADQDGNPVPAEVLGVPAELRLDFERNQLDFEYAVKAGAKEGEYTLTVTPEVGSPVKVAVTVK
jgi:hypothetical protein